MNKFYIENKEDLRILIVNTARKKNISEAVIEKDFKNLNFEFSIDTLDPQTILCKYPKIFESNYLTQNIRLEIGSLAAWTPAINVGILPIIGEAYPSVFKEKTNIRTVSAERTFWEKATILHHEVNRPEKSLMPHRYSRHFYDLYKIANSEFKDKALSDKYLLKKVIEFKMKFYPRKWARYEEALNGKLKLVPRDHRFKEIEEDYKAMAEMIYGEYPSFEEIINVLQELEKEINK